MGKWRTKVQLFVFVHTNKQHLVCQLHLVLIWPCKAPPKSRGWVCSEVIVVCARSLQCTCTCSFWFDWRQCTCILYLSGTVVPYYEVLVQHPIIVVHLNHTLSLPRQIWESRLMSLISPTSSLEILPEKISSIVRNAKRLLSPTVQRIPWAVWTLVPKMKKTRLSVTIH